ncbi:acyl-CoA dehydrogenase [Azotobacter vinelandii CA]|uniref:Acyl-CoA dehydrogenase n=2 Tax=Azotobacter vinelandii TaxID=354 RepID=C1DQX0_AZOVD|nr:acyl-CoA dehydrogenase family protein [Azotobacter vinelandii]ACO77643.1 acyl-CoA dehydrogenase [Azotobacter vinelandii DJ]AGK15326.1 acyl-CoA dehydrogenase [Azotobacter vinelandii CA]AGK19902.1 acyl-CoA dehydrogenase [Azotobacter vinelandii CA6]SFY28988.1 Acyl-CoA dehydrogenase [Azotobacter vinelandii]GLK61709.1 acyl-CoA dehydrogenase [Azotobacter vinelandii]
MWHYQAPLRDMRFVIEEWLAAPADWQGMPAFESLDGELAAQVIEEAARFASGVLAPLNAPGDRQGCRFENGRVTTPDGFPAAYRAFVEGGWAALACAPEDGGQGLPQLLNAALLEMIYSTNHAWAMYPGIAHGAYECLRAHGTPELRERYLADIVSGEILPTMCLTEPQAGSDVGLLRSRAEPAADGGYRLSGSKLFASGGEHDLTGNILHLVLARLPDAPPGSRGISLFLVPKLLPDGRRNAVRCDGIEHKLGIRGSATCTLSFEHAEGWLLGEPHKGLAAMFVMMNSARLHVGLQGLGHAEAAWQNAAQYAAERRQMRAVRRPPGRAEAPADPIHYHPAMRRVLLELRTLTEGMRALGYWTAHLLDEAEQGADPARRARAQGRAMLLTPLVKAFFTEQGFRLASAALQVFGGYGYVQEYAIEQTLRDSRIAMIYEGSNEIQANDLLLRKVLGDGGAVLRDLLEEFRAEAEVAAICPDCAAFAATLAHYCDCLTTAAEGLAAATTQDPERPYRAAGDFLRLLGLVALAFAWLRSARLAAGRGGDPFYAGKLESAAFFFAYLLPEADHRLALIEASRQPLPFLPE